VQHVVKKALTYLVDTPRSVGEPLRHAGGALRELLFA